MHVQQSVLALLMAATFHETSQQSAESDEFYLPSLPWYIADSSKESVTVGDISPFELGTFNRSTTTTTATEIRRTPESSSATQNNTTTTQSDFEMKFWKLSTASTKSSGDGEKTKPPCNGSSGGGQNGDGAATFASTDSVIITTIPPSTTSTDSTTLTTTSTTTTATTPATTTTTTATTSTTTVTSTAFATSSSTISPFSSYSTSTSTVEIEASSSTSSMESHTATTSSSSDNLASTSTIETEAKSNEIGNSVVETEKTEKSSVDIRKREPVQACTYDQDCVFTLGPKRGHYNEDLMCLDGLCNRRQSIFAGGQSSSFVNPFVAPNPEQNRRITIDAGSRAPWIDSAPISPANPAPFIPKYPRETSQGVFGAVDNTNVVDNTNNLPDQKPCQRTQECTWMIGGVEMMHPDYHCVVDDDNVQKCLKNVNPGNYGCRSDAQCTIKCPNTHCSPDATVRNAENERPCVCNPSPIDNSVMYIYSDKCWQGCPYLTKKVMRKGLPKCVSEGSPTWQKRLLEFHRRSKRQMSKIMC